MSAEVNADHVKSAKVVKGVSSAVRVGNDIRAIKELEAGLQMFLVLSIFNDKWLQIFQISSQSMQHGVLRCAESGLIRSVTTVNQLHGSKCCSKKLWNLDLRSGDGVVCCFEIFMNSAVILPILKQKYQEI